jgi:hypothetical protein
MAKEILDKLNTHSEDEKKQMCLIIGSHHKTKGFDNLEFRVIWDADLLVNLPKQYPKKDKNNLNVIANKIFKTSTGKELALKQIENYHI